MKQLEQLRRAVADFIAADPLPVERLWYEPGQAPPPQRKRTERELLHMEVNGAARALWRALGKLETKKEKRNG